MGVEHWKEAPLIHTLSFNSSWASSTSEPWMFSMEYGGKPSHQEYAARFRGQRAGERCSFLPQEPPETPVPSAFPTVPVDAAVSSDLTGEQTRGWSCEHCVGIMK